MNVSRPALRYHGGKWMLAPWIIEHFPDHRVYTEAFGGGASVLLRKVRSYAEVYNDLDSEVVNLFTALREFGPQLMEQLRLTPFSRDEFERSYEPCEWSPIEQARRTVVRSFQGFGSNSLATKTGFRASSSRSGTTPARDWQNYPAAMNAMIERLRGVVIENKDALEVILQHDSPSTLHYVDPPYVHSTRREGAGKGARAGYKHEMSDEAHIRLANELRRLQGVVIVSGYPSEVYNVVYRGWRRIDRPALADGAQERTECLWVSENWEKPTIQRDIFALDYAEQETAC